MTLALLDEVTAQNEASGALHTPLPPGFFFDAAVPDQSVLQSSEAALAFSGS